MYAEALATIQNIIVEIASSSSSSLGARIHALNSATAARSVVATSSLLFESCHNYTSDRDFHHTSVCVIPAIPWLSWQNV